MKTWNNSPPSYEEWERNSFDGFYWVKGLDETGTELISVVKVYYNPSTLVEQDLIAKPRLCAVPLEGGQSFYLDNQEDIEGIQWQPIKPPDESQPSLDTEGTPV